MLLRRLWLVDFRNFGEATIDLAVGLTAFVGENGQGKTNVLEAAGFVSTLLSFRGASTEHLVRSGGATAILRAEGAQGDRELLVEVEIPLTGRVRAQLNRQRLRRAADLAEVAAVTVFAPGDLDLIKEGPAGRRMFLDELLVSINARHGVVLGELERILRQRAALLRQCAGRLSNEAELTLDVWDSKLAPVGERVAALRSALVDALAEPVSQAYGELAGGGEPVVLRYEAPWRDLPYGEALAQARSADLARALTTVGPHRDELVVSLAGLPARMTASQGEQRCLALALKLAGHRLATQRRGEAPLLLLDDVFSELDPQRAAALLAHLPPGQTLLSSASRLPDGAQAELVYEVRGGTLVARGSATA